MTITSEVVQVAASTGGGNQNITGSFGGLTPVAVWFEVTPATVNNTPVDDAIISTGAYDGTNEWVAISTDNHGQGSTDGSQGMRNDACILLWLAGTSTVDGQASGSSLIANGVTINWSNAPAGAYLIKATFLFGITNITAGTFQPGTSVGTPVSVTSPGYEPTWGWFAATDNNNGGTSTGRNQFTYGAAINDGSETQRCIAFYQNDGAGTSAVNEALFTDRIAASIRGGSDWEVELTGWTASGFDVTLRNNSAGTAAVGYLVADTGALGVYLGTHDTPTSTGNQSSTAPGFPPQIVKFGMSHLAATDSVVTTGDAGTMGCYTFTASDEYSWALAIEDGAGTTNSQSMVDNNLSLPQDDGTAGFVAAFVSMDANGWTTNFTTTDVGTARKFWAFALEEESAGVTVSPTPVSAVGVTIDPTVILGSMTITPTSSSAVGTTVNPTVVLGSMTVTTTPVSAVGVTVGPSVVIGGAEEEDEEETVTIGAGERLFTAPAETAAPTRKTPGVAERNITTLADGETAERLTPVGSPGAGQRSFTEP